MFTKRKTDIITQIYVWAEMYPIGPIIQGIMT
jgi:hypothetical protein